MTSKDQNKNTPSSKKNTIDNDTDKLEELMDHIKTENKALKKILKALTKKP